jgi:hypothetical protein
MQIAVHSCNPGAQQVVREATPQEEALIIAYRAAMPTSPAPTTEQKLARIGLTRQDLVDLDLGAG